MVSQEIIKKRLDLLENEIQKQFCSGGSAFTRAKNLTDWGMIDTSVLYFWNSEKLNAGNWHVGASL